jgi:hypothetical protein
MRANVGRPVNILYAVLYRQLIQEGTVPIEATYMALC